MNETVILKMVEPYLSDRNELWCSEFDSIFSMLSQKEKEEALIILQNNNISIVDDSEAVIEESDADFDVLYDDDIFAAEDIDTVYENSIDNTYEYLAERQDFRLTNNTLLKFIKEGSEQAKQDFCIANKRLVYKYAIAYSKKYKHKLSIDDLVQAGMLGMLKAIDKFDFNEGTAFSTYAVWWIRQTIVREIYDQGFTIRIPVHMMEKINKVNSLDAEFSDIEDLAERIKEISLASGYPMEIVAECLALRKNYINTTSLDAPVGEEGESFLSDFIVDNKNPSVEDILFNKVLDEEIYQVLDCLKEKEKDIICLRFGLGGEEPHTLEEVGKKYGVTRERIRQIEAKAIRKLKSPRIIKRLKEFVE